MIRIATIGTSTITRTFLDAAAAVPRVAVTTAYSRDGERARRFAAQTGIPGSASDLDGLLTSADIDAVYIASPNAIHFTQALRAVEAGDFQTEIAAVTVKSRKGETVVDGEPNPHDILRLLGVEPLAQRRHAVAASDRPSSRGERRHGDVEREQRRLEPRSGQALLQQLGVVDLGEGVELDVLDERVGPEERHAELFHQQWSERIQEMTWAADSPE